VGLALVVGFLADIKDQSDKFLPRASEWFATLNRCLDAAGVGTFQEPIDLPRTARFSCDMFGYSGLHHLRRLAAYVALGETLYRPGSDLPESEPTIDRYYEIVGEGNRSDLPFQHLMLHGDAEGFYVPLDFARVIDPGDLSEELCGAIGSAHQLLKECKTLSGVLELPDSMDYNSEQLWNAAGNPGHGDAKWQQWGIEAFTCIRLTRACERALEVGAAVVFC